MTVVMVGWNYVITPIYLKISQADVVAMLLPIIVPFNLIKAAINSAIVFMIHKPVLNVFKKHRLIDTSINSQKASNYVIAIILIARALILLSLVNSL